MLAALACAGCRTLSYLPEVAGGKAPPFTHPSVAWGARARRAFPGLHAYYPSRRHSSRALALVIDAIRHKG